MEDNKARLSKGPALQGTPRSGRTRYERPELRHLGTVNKLTLSASVPFNNDGSKGKNG
jgi:hypothetical protein